MGFSLSSIALGRILDDESREELRRRIREHVDRSQLQRYRTGKRKPGADLIAWLDHVSDGEISASGWGESFASGTPIVESLTIVEDQPEAGVGFVYFAASGSWVKVGWTTNPDRRFLQLIGKSPLERDLRFRLFVGPCSKSYETKVLRALGKPDLGNEFFRVSDKIVDLLSQEIDSSVSSYEPIHKPRRKLTGKDRKTIYTIASHSGADPRTVERWFRGEPTARVTDNAIRFTVRQLGIKLDNEGNEKND